MKTIRIIKTSREAVFLVVEEKKKAEKRTQKGFYFQMKFVGLKRVMINNNQKFILYVKLYAVT